MRRHDGYPFRESERMQSGLAGLALHVVGACVYLKADLAEFAHTVAFPSTAHNTHPCFLCWCKRDGLVRFDGWTVLSVPWPLKSFQQYKEACEKCEIWRTVNENHYRDLCALLVYDKRPGGGRGLALRSDFAALNLRRGDRVEPCHELPDVDLFLHLEELPRKILFWRTSEESLARHRNPLFSDETGLNPQA